MHITKPTAWNPLYYILLMPASALYFGVASSFALGTLIASIIIIFLYDSKCRKSLLSSVKFSQVLIPSAIGLCFLIFHLFLVVFVAESNTTFNLPRAIASSGLLIIFIAAILYLSKYILSISMENLDKGLKNIFILMCLILIFSFFNLSPPTFGENWRKPIFPFTEPSHFAITFTPILLYVSVITKKSIRYSILAFSCMMALAVQNLTMLCGVLLVCMITLRISMLIFLFLIATFFIQNRVDLSYFQSRTDFSMESNNLSTLVYIQGWQMTDEAIRNTHGLGLGFQQLGINTTNVPAAVIIRSMRNGEDSNVLDGSFVASKLIGEFGILGIALVIKYIVMALKSGWELRKYALRKIKIDNLLILVNSSICGFFIEMFVRGSGYFSGTMLFFIASLLIRNNLKRINTRLIAL